MILCAVSIIVFLAIVLPGVFDVKHSHRAYVISAPVKRIVIDAGGTTDLHISLSHDGQVHVQRGSAVSRDSQLIERHELIGKTLTLRSSCTGSRLGVLRRCDLTYRLQVPKRVALSLRVHLGSVTVNGTEGRLDFKSDAGDFDGSGCSKRAYFSLGFSRLRFRDTCVPAIVHARVRLGGVELTVPAGRYDVSARTHFGGGVQRPFENIIEDTAAPNKIDVDVKWGGSIRIHGASS